MNAVNPAPDILDIGIDEECPLDHTPNATTIAAMLEGEAILRGEIPGAITIDPTRYQTREELETTLKKALQS